MAKKHSNVVKQTRRRSGESARPYGIELLDKVSLLAYGLELKPPCTQFLSYIIKCSTEIIKPGDLNLRALLLPLRIRPTQQIHASVGFGLPRKASKEYIPRKIIVTGVRTVETQRQVERRQECALPRYLHIGHIPRSSARPAR